MAKFVDTHAHLNHEDFRADLEEAIQRALRAGVSAIIVPGYDIESSERAVDLASTHKPIFAAVGIHPHDAKTFDAASLATLKNLAAKSKVVAIGEVGLDFHYNLSPREKQMEAFAAQAVLSRELGLPLIVHTRDSASEALDILKRNDTPGPAGGVMHYFSADEQTALEARLIGLALGVAGPITYTKNDALREVISHIGIDGLVIETDSPYSAPQQFRGSRNEPAYVPLVAGKLAELFNYTVDHIAGITSATAAKLFRLAETE